MSSSSKGTPPPVLTLRVSDAAAVAVALFGAATAVGIIGPAPRVARAQTGASVGTLRVVRQVRVTRGPVTPGMASDYVDARDRSPVVAGQGVRTLKRSLAEVNFADASVLRVNERTDLVIQNSASLRNIQLGGGAVWVRVAKGVRTQVETPTATAVARGTVFTVQVLPGGGTRLTVLEGTVEMRVGEKVVVVSPGQTIVSAPDGSLPDEPTNVPLSELPVEFGGSVQGWWSSLAENVGVLTTPGSDFLFDLRSSPLTETLQQIAAADYNAANAGPGPRDYFLPTQQQRLTFFGNSNTALRDAWTAFRGNPSAYLSANGAQPLSALGLSADQIAALGSLDIASVGDAVQTFQANAAAAGVTVNLEGRAATSRQVYRTGSLTGQPNFDYRLLDRNDTSLAFVGIGAAVALIADAGKLSAGVGVPTLGAQIFGFAQDGPQVQGQRGRIDGGFGQTRYHAEGNVVRLLTGNNVQTFSRADSVLYVERPLGQSVNVFAGRRRFYEGPAFQNQSLSQLIADRYTGAGATFKGRGFSATAAYLYDSNPDVRGAQNGALGSAQFRGFGGTLGLHYLKVPKLDGGDGYSLSLTYPVLPNVVDFYGEAGRAADKTGIQTYGAYFPGLFQRTDTDLFVEYSGREAVGHTLSLIASRDLGPNFNVRAFGAFAGTARERKIGLAGVFRFGSGQSAR